MNLPVPSQTLTGLVRAAQAGNAQALDQLLHALRPWLLNYAARFCAEHLCDDVVQEVQVLMVGKLHQLRKPAAFPAWLCQITRRTAQRLQRQWQRSTGSPLQELSQPAGGSTPLESLERKERQELVREAVDDLKEPYRQAVRDHHLNHMSVEEISRRHGCPVGTVKRRLHTGRKKLHENLETKLAV